MSRIGPVRTLGLVATGFVIGVATTLSIAALANGTVAESIYRKLEVLAQVLGQIENHYVDPVSPTDLVYGAAKGAVAVLDEHSAFFTPEEYRELLDATEGEYAGVGIELEWDQELPRVTTVLEGSPAARGDVRVGDRVVAIDGAPIAGLSSEAAQQKMRGPVGSKVALTVRRAGEKADRPLSLVRSWVRVAPIEARRLDDGIAYVRIKTFSRRVAFDFGAALAREANTRGLILDLRGDPGGLFDEAVAVSDLFLRDGPIVTAIGRGGQVLDHYEAHDQGHEPDYPIAVLIDHGTASAAEIVAGSLSDRGRARLFGSKSYGKGSVQSVIDLPDGSGLKLTVARYYTPSGKQIDKHGITPDEIVEPTKDHEDAPLAAAVKWLRASSHPPSP